MHLDGNMPGGTRQLVLVVRSPEILLERVVGARVCRAADQHCAREQRHRFMQTFHLFHEYAPLWSNMAGRPPLLQHPSHSTKSWRRRVVPFRAAGDEQEVCRQSTMQLSA